MFYYVINIYKGNYSIEGKYRQRDSAERRADNIYGGETHVFASFSTDPAIVLDEFKAEQIGKL